MSYTLASWSSKITEPLLESFNNMYKGISDMLPRVIVALVIIIIGLIVAKVITKSLSVTLEKIKFEALLSKIGITGVLEKIGLKSSICNLIAKLLFYIIMLFVFKSAAGALGMADIVKLVDSVIEFLPKVITASAILLFGFVIAETIQNVVRNTLESMSVDYARPLSNVIFGFVFVIILTVALDQLEIQTELLNDSVKIILAALGLAAAIALGFGLKGLSKGIVSGVYVRDLYKPGTEIEIDGELVKVAGVGPVTTKLTKRDGGFIIIPNSTLINSKIKGESAEQ